MRPNVKPVLAALALLVAACGPSTPPPQPPANNETPDVEPHHGDNVSVESEIGALNEEKVRRTFELVAPTLNKCLSQGLQNIPYMSGDVRLTVRVKSDGHARVAFLKESTLGDRATEECMIRAVKNASWPKPVGGKEGIAESTFSFELDGEERPPVAWSPERVSAPMRGARSALGKCKAAAGSAQLKATIYVETDGKPKSIGVSTSEEHGEGAIQCVIDALSNITFPSPGSYASKVTVPID